MFVRTEAGFSATEVLLVSANRRTSCQMGLMDESRQLRLIPMGACWHGNSVGVALTATSSDTPRIKGVAMLDNSTELTTWDRDHFFHPWTHVGAHSRGDIPTRVIGRGEGIYITDSCGKTSLDAFAGLFCVNVG